MVTITRQRPGWLTAHVTAIARVRAIVARFNLPNVKIGATSEGWGVTSGVTSGVVNGAVMTGVVVLVVGGAPAVKRFVVVAHTSSLLRTSLATIVCSPSEGVTSRPASVEHGRAMPSTVQATVVAPVYAVVVWPEVKISQWCLTPGCTYSAGEPVSLPAPSSVTAG